MRIPLIGLILGFLSLASALSAAGSKLLVVLEEEGERSKYSQFFNDLEGNRTLRLNNRN
jgi:oligosaccharyltransferase complex subunit beta